MSKNNKIHIIGINHGPSLEYVKLKKSLVYRSSLGELVLGLEGLVRNDALETLHANEFYSIPKGFLYGIEEDLPLIACSITSNYIYLGFPTDTDHYERRINIAKASTINELLDSKSMKEIFQASREREY